MDVQLDDIKFRLNNLIRNNEELNNVINNLLDEHAKEIYPDLKPVIEETLTHVFLSFLNGVHKKFSIDELYPK